MFVGGTTKCMCDTVVSHDTPMISMTRKLRGCLHGKTRTGASFIPGWLRDFVSHLHDDWERVSFFIIPRPTFFFWPTCWSWQSHLGLPANRFHTETSGRFVFTWYRCKISYRSDILAPVREPGWTHGDWRRHDILWWYHVNKCRAMRGNQSEIAPARKLPRCRVNTPLLYGSLRRGQDDPNRALWLVTRAEPSFPPGTTGCIPQANFPESHIISP